MASYREELWRLNTFENWPKPEVDVKKLAMCGFYHLAADNDSLPTDYVECAFCNLTLKDWTKDDDPFIRHASNSFCPFLMNMDVGNVPLSAPGHHVQIVEAPTYVLNKKMIEYNARLKTFCSIFPLWTGPLPERMALCGWFRVDRKTVQCFQCGGKTNNWHVTNSPYHIHNALFPRCKTTWESPNHDDDMCGMCFGKKRVINIPCGHVYNCDYCLTQNKNLCPVCRVAISNTYKVFFC